MPDIRIAVPQERSKTMAANPGSTPTTPASEEGKPSDKETKSNPLKDYLSSIVALVVLIVYAVFIFYLLTLTNLQETAWSRAVYLFGGTEAIAFAAAGFFFGNTVQRQQTDKAEKDANAANKKKDQAEAERNRSEIEKATIVSKADDLKQFISSVIDRRGKAALAPDPDIQSIQDFAGKLFP
jgi:hypothetical protein